jgi:hypothetical protein
VKEGAMKEEERRRCEVNEKINGYEYTRKSIAQYHALLIPREEVQNT